MRTIAILLVTLLALLSESPALALDFPLHDDDLAAGERVSTTVHSSSDVAQTGAKDLRILRWVADDNWLPLKAGTTDESVNANYLVYGRPVYAMAGGTVVACWRNAPENTGHSKRSEVATGRILLAGNHIWIRQADGKIALYAHAITGDIPKSLCPKSGVLLASKAKNKRPIWTEPETVVSHGATISAGQLLFHAGNSGNSSEPHLHVHVVDSSNTWQPLRFERGQTTSFDSRTASLDGPWTSLQGAALPLAAILIWPPHAIGNFAVNGIEVSSYQRVFEHFADSGEMLDSVACKGNGKSYDTSWIPAKGYWLHHLRMSVAEHAAKNESYVSQGYKETFVSTCGALMAAIWRKP